SRGQAPDHGCLPGPNGSGHPLFATPVLRGDRAFAGGAEVFAEATQVSFADLDGDGIADAALALWQGGLPSSPSYVSVCLGRGNGVFGEPTRYLAGPECCAVEIADVNRDGHPDLVAANASGNTISIFLNLGNGTFSAPVTYPVGSQPRSLKIGDLNGDGWPD